ncbi:MAG: iron hydrogenase [Patescibacteria group bacterium]|jgi:hypothetical protein
MSYIKEQAMAKVDTAAIAQFLSLATIATALPFFIHIQWLTGPIVNAILIIAIFLAGIRGALLLCLIPSLMALSGGLLPAVLAPVVPFIMISNTLLVLGVDFVYSRSRDAVKGFAAGVLAGASIKFLFLFLTVGLMSNLVIKKELSFKIAQMMSWSQLVTALIGGVLAFIFLKWLKRI